MDGLREPTLVCLLLATLILVYERRRASRAEIVTGVLLGLTGALAVVAAAGAVVA
ncbi:MAG: hypothetical protein M3137_01180 [Actinomycetota bacterium]|nr:hypothetical protein [Actinomycetota bacterium]